LNKFLEANDELSKMMGVVSEKQEKIYLLENGVENIDTINIVTQNKKLNDELVQSKYKIESLTNDIDTFHKKNQELGETINTLMKLKSNSIQQPNLFVDDPSLEKIYSLYPELPLSIDDKSRVEILYDFLSNKEETKLKYVTVRDFEVGDTVIFQPTEWDNRIYQILNVRSPNYYLHPETSSQFSEQLKNSEPVYGKIIFMDHLLMENNKNQYKLKAGTPYHLVAIEKVEL